MVFDPENKDVSVSSSNRNATSSLINCFHKLQKQPEIVSPASVEPSPKRASPAPVEPSPKRASPDSDEPSPNRASPHLIDTSLANPQSPVKSPSPADSFSDIPPPSPVSLTADDFSNRLSRVYENGISSNATSPTPYQGVILCPNNLDKKLNNHAPSGISEGLEPQDTVITIDSIDKTDVEPIPVSLPDIVVNSKHGHLNGKYDSNESLEITKIINTAV